MKKQLAAVWCGGASAVAMAALMVACVGDVSPSTAPRVDGTSTTDSARPVPDPAPGSDASTAARDASDELEGGGLLPIEPDAGFDTDAGVDAGPACVTVTPAGYSSSTCSSRVVSMVGGALTTTTYELAGVTVVGSAAFCGTEFVPYEHRGGLEVTATSPTAATFRFFDLYRRPSLPPVTPSNQRYDATVVASGNQLTLGPTACAQKPAPASASYSVVANGAKKELHLRLPYGAGSAIYKFVER